MEVHLGFLWILIHEQGTEVVGCGNVTWVQPLKYKMDNSKKLFRRNPEYENTF